MEGKILTREEIESLPASSMLDLTDGQTGHPNGLIYDAEGKVLARKESFVYEDGIRYPSIIAPMPDSQPPEDYLTREANEPERDTPRPILWSEFSKMKFPENRWIVKDLVPAGGITILAAPSGEKKTWLALEMAKSIATGESFLDHFETEKGAVLYLDGEMAKSDMQKRCKLLGLPEGISFWFWNHELDLYNDELNIEWLFEFIGSQKISAVFFDTFRAFAGGLEEAKAELVREFFNKLKPLKDKGIGVIILDHCRKPNRFEGQTPKKEQLFASQDKPANAEILLMLKSSAGSDDIFVYQLKNRLGKEIEPFQVALQDEVDEQGEATSVKIGYKGQFTAQEHKLELAEDVVLGALTDGGKTTKQLVEIVLEAKIGERNAREAIRALDRKGKIIAAKLGRENFYTLPPDEEIVSIDEASN